MDSFQSHRNDPHEEGQKYDLSQILSGVCPRCGADLQIDSKRPRVGAPDERIRCQSCGFTFDISKATSYRLGNSDVDLKLQTGWLTSIRSGRLPHFTVRRQSGEELPLSDWIRSAGTIFRACNLIVFIAIAIIFIIILLWK
jgi:DNA-directed RNA polymerase subunit RPC12/RpoP